MKISMIGSGAMGSLFGGRLSLAGRDVVLYDVFREHVEAINRDGPGHRGCSNGERHRGPSRGEHRSPGRGGLRRVHRLREVDPTERRPAVRTACREDHHRADAPERLGNEEIIRQAFRRGADRGGGHVAGGDVPGARADTARGQGADAPRMADGESGRLAGLVQALQAAGFETHLEKDVADLVWSKLVINVGINALTAITGQPNGGLLEMEETRAIMADLVGEAVAVARRRGIHSPTRTRWQRCSTWPERPARNRSSMLQDFDRKRESEIEFMNGAIVREAAALGIRGAGERRGHPDHQGHGKGAPDDCTRGKKRLLAFVDRDELVALTWDLVRIDSVIRPETGGRRSGTWWLPRELDQAELGVESLVEEVAPGRENLIATAQSGRPGRCPCSRAIPTW